MDASATTPTTPAAQLPVTSPVAGLQTPTEPTSPGFRERGRIRRRLRFLRRARELAYRDLGGLVFEMHRLAQRRDELVAPKLATLQRIDSELHSLETALGDRRSVTVLREAGVTACPRCAAIHASEDRFCPACGLAMGRHADRPIATAPTIAATPALAGPTPASPIPGPTPPSPTPTGPTAPTSTPIPATPPALSGAPLSPPPVTEQPTQVLPTAGTPAVEDQPTHAFEPPATDVAPSPEESSGDPSAKS